MPPPGKCRRGRMPPSPPVPPPLNGKSGMFQPAEKLAPMVSMENSYQNPKVTECVMLML